MISFFHLRIWDNEFDYMGESTKVDRRLILTVLATGVAAVFVDCLSAETRVWDIND